VTGKENYDKFSKFIGEDCVSNPDLVSTKYPLSSAAFFFTTNTTF
jgi:putative chitinase